jgi:predicted ABC-type ATPase
VPPQNDKRPTLWIVGGPNGSGKSTLYTKLVIEEFSQSIWIINPDLLAQRIVLSERRNLADSNLEAVKRIEAWLWASIAAYQTVGVETVLSTPKYRPLVAAARKNGFEIRLIYVVLDDVAKNIERVRLRVKKGGHDVPEDRIRARYKRSLRQLPWFLRRADKAWIYDNSGEEPHLMAAKQDDTITVYPLAFPAVRKILTSMRVKQRRLRS